MRRKEVERRSKKYAAVQNVSVSGWSWRQRNFVKNTRFGLLIRTHVIISYRQKPHHDLRREP
jgi:hypothetical protein